MNSILSKMCKEYIIDTFERTLSKLKELIAIEQENNLDTDKSILLINIIELIYNYEDEH